MPVTYTYPYTQYTGIWKLNAASAAQGAGTWPVPPSPHLFGWGAGGTGSLGLGNTTSYSSPKQVGALTNWSLISGANISSFGIKTDGTLWAWGAGHFGALGLGNTTYYSSPKQVGSLSNWSKIAKGQGNWSSAIKTDGTLWTWGYNNAGQLGLGNTTNYSSPKQVGALTNWLKTVGGGYHCLAIKTDGSLWSWGTNGLYNGSAPVRGQLGLNTSTTSYSSPVQVGGLTNWLNVSAGEYFSAATKTDGTLWTWGQNNFGQLGLGNTTNYSSPKQVGSLTNWSNKNFAFYSIAAIKTDGTLWTWGYNSNGQLGLGNTTYYSSPKQVGSLTNWSAVSCGYSTTYSLKTDGTLWAWGYNGQGQLGNGNNTSYSSPIQVGALTTWSQITCGQNYPLGIAKT